LLVDAAGEALFPAYKSNARKLAGVTLRYGQSSLAFSLRSFEPETRQTTLDAFVKQIFSGIDRGDSA